MRFSDLTPNNNLEEIERQSRASLQLIFKHSTRCIISSMALKRLKSCPEINADCWVLDLLSFRELSNTLANRYNIQHQSPQIIVLKDGVVIGNASHERIDADFILTFYEK